MLLWRVLVAERRDVESTCSRWYVSVPNGFDSVHLIRPLSSLIFLSVTSVIPLLKCSYEALAIILPEIFISGGTDNK